MSFKISYAQNREDYLIEAFFPDITKGFYVDVGANDPNEDSVTKIFYKKGWTGINIEPVEAMVKLLNKYRPKDINLALGIADKPGELHFREYGGAGMSTFSEPLKREYKDAKNPNVVDFVDKQVKVDTLSNVFRKYVKPDQAIQFIKIDVEGFEFEVIAGNDWDKYRPELICIEANHVKNDWRPLLKSNRYNQVFFDGLNEYYLREESMRRAKLFSYPEAILTGQQIIKWTVEKEVGIITNTYKNNITHLHKQVAELNDMLQSEHAKQAALKQEYAKAIKVYDSLRRLKKRTTRAS
jgi:FkbM family methyltransferase